MEDMGAIWFATWFWISGAGVRYDKIVPIQPPNLKKTPFQQNQFFQDANSALYFYQHAATRSRLQPLDWLQVAAGASGRKRPLKQVHGSHLQPSGPQVAAPEKWPQVAAPEIPSEWPQVAASGRFRPNQFPPSKATLWNK